MPDTLNAAQAYRGKVAERYTVRMPSGAVFKVKPVNAFWFAARVQSLPTSAIARAEGIDPTLPLDPALREANSALTQSLIEDHVLEPKIRANPSADDEIGFDELLPEDAKFLLDYLLGRVDKDGNAVETFPKQ